MSTSELTPTGRTAPPSLASVTLGTATATATSTTKEPVIKASGVIEDMEAYPDTKMLTLGLWTLGTG